MKKIYFTITVMSHYYGDNFFEKGMTVTLVKEKDNEVDSEAIKVELEGLGTVGYVANSPYTVLGESYSAGRLYDRGITVESGHEPHKQKGGTACRFLQRNPNIRSFRKAIMKSFCGAVSATARK